MVPMPAIGWGGLAAMAASGLVVAAGRHISTRACPRYRAYVWGECEWSRSSEIICARLRQLPQVIQAIPVAGHFHVLAVVEGTKWQVEQTLELIEGIDRASFLMHDACWTVAEIEPSSKMTPKDPGIGESAVQSWFNIRIAPDDQEYALAIAGRLPHVHEVIPVVGPYDILVGTRAGQRDVLTFLETLLHQILRPGALSWATTNLALGSAHL